jgi:hypothetical protein
MFCTMIARLARNVLAQVRGERAPVGIIAAADVRRHDQADRLAAIKSSAAALPAAAIAIVASTAKTHMGLCMARTLLPAWQR